MGRKPKEKTEKKLSFETEFQTKGELSVCGIYKIVSKVHPEKLYIGSAINIYNRKYHHLYSLRKNDHENPRLQNHFNKYGKSDLVFSVLLICAKEDLLVHEQYFIDLYKPYFNICLVAGSALGRTQSDGCKQKVSNANRGRKHTEESRLNMSNAQRGRVFPPEHRLKISMALKGRPKSERARENMSKAAMGRIVSEETRHKKSIATRGRPHSEEHNHKVSVAITKWWAEKKSNNGEKKES